VKHSARLCSVYPQENPPVEGPQLAGLNPPGVEAPHEKEDINLQASALPQEGQRRSLSLSEAKTSCSKICPQALHLNSYIGIFAYPPKTLFRHQYVFIRAFPDEKVSPNLTTRTFY